MMYDNALVSVRLAALTTIALFSPHVLLSIKRPLTLIVLSWGNPDFDAELFRYLGLNAAYVIAASMQALPIFVGVFTLRREQ